MARFTPALAVADCSNRRFCLRSLDMSADRDIGPRTVAEIDPATADILHRHAHQALLTRP